MTVRTEEPADRYPGVAGDRTDQTWTVRELADELGVSTRTLRFYEAEGLISPHREGTARIYSLRDRARLRLILRGKRFGMSLSDIAEIVGMYDGAASSERRQLETLLARLTELETDLRARQDDLRRTVAEVVDVAGQCRVRLDELSGPGRSQRGERSRYRSPAPRSSPSAAGVSRSANPD